GPIAPTVDCCARLDAVLSGRQYQPLRPISLKGLRFAVPTDYMLSDLDDTVAKAFSRSLDVLRQAGASVIEAPAPVLAAVPELMEGGGFTAAESYFVHRQSLADHGDLYDPRVRGRIERGAAITAADYLELCRRRQQRKQEADEWLRDYDGLLAPTVPVVPPRFEELTADEDYGRLNLLILRNPTVANMLDLCAITLPNFKPGDLPSGLMLIGRNGTDDVLLRLAQAIEHVL
ncbi:MAG TPA: amidase family protein, partial [Thioalkalivibrio sp.]|nr:amidase family protein [Thioalkalivibrio sp.]